MKDQRTFEQIREIHRQHLKNLTYPKYKPDEIEAMSYIKAHIQKKMHMNFHSDIEDAFMMGFNFAKSKETNP